jgi:hypothetical protein
MSQSSIAIRAAELAYEAEKRNAKALGHDRLDSAVLSFGAFCDVLTLAYSDDRPIVRPRFRRLIR